MEIDIVDLWKAIRQRLVLIIILAGVAVLITGIVNFYILTPKYEAVTKVIVIKQSSDQTIEYDDLLTGEKLLKTYSEIVKSNRVAEDVISSLKLNISPKQLMNQLKVQGSSESLIVSIIIVDEDPAKAVAISNAFSKHSLNEWKAIMKMDNIHILDEAKLDTRPSPVWPKPFLYMTMSFVITIMVGIVLAILLEFIDKTLKTEEQIEQMLRLPVLGVIPMASKKMKKEKKQNKEKTEERERRSEESN